MAINTKWIIANALLDLCSEKSLEKISVSDIIKKAGTGRQTFYNHFRDKNDLIYWIFKRTITRERQLVENEGFFAYLTHVYSEARKYSAFLEQACRYAGQNSLSESIYLQTYNYYKLFILAHYGSAVFDEKLEYALRFNAEGACGRYVHWVKEGMEGDPETQAKFALHCIPYAIKQYLPLTKEELEY